VPSELYAGRVSSRSLNAIAEDGNHLVQRLDLFIGDAGLGDLHELEHGLRVDEGEEASEVAGTFTVSKASRAACLRKGKREWRERTPLATCHIA
jgi:hypothetical protein